MRPLAIIGGTGLIRLKALEVTRRETVSTPFGEPSGPLTRGRFGGREVVFLARHGAAHTIAPHRVNYRANLWALKEIGVGQAFAIAAVGGIRSDMVPGRLAIPDQVIDYTWGRGHTFFEDGLEAVTHVDFTYPYHPSVRQALLSGAAAAGIEVCPDGTYGATQGPRLETAREIDRMERDGCDLVGMTGMPEAALARELEIDYAACAVVANRAAGRGDGEITMTSIEQHLRDGIAKVSQLLEQAVGRV